MAAKGLSGYGAGEDIYWAGFPAEVSGTNRYLLLGFGWQVIGCKVAKGSQAGINPFEGTYALNSAKQVLKEKPSSRLVVVIHGNFEFERYLQPGHRKLSRELIDCGVYAVIFHHPHIVGPIERYKGKLIAHSLGNWAFSYGKHFEGKLRFPKTSFHQIALELDDDKSIVHHSRFDPPNEVNYLFPESVDAFDFTLRPIFEEYDDVEYMRWFKKNRLKRMGLPIYKDANSSVFNSIRDAWVYVRQLVIVIMVHLNMKSHSRRA